MSILYLLKSEILHRKLNFVFSVIAVVTAATLFVAGPTILRGYQRDSDQRLSAMQAETDKNLEAMEEKAVKDLADLDKKTKRIMRDLGFNLRIIHKNTDLTQLFAKFVSFDMPESYVDQPRKISNITSPKAG